MKFEQLILISETEQNFFKTDQSILKKLTFKVLNCNLIYFLF